MAKPKRQLRDAYRFPGFVPLAEVYGVFGDPMQRVVPLRRRAKKQSVVNAVERGEVSTIVVRGWHGICRAARCESSWSSKFDA
jgi:hypothetical protein